MYEPNEHTNDRNHPAYDDAPDMRANAIEHAYHSDAVRAELRDTIDAFIGSDDIDPHANYDDVADWFVMECDDVIVEETTGLTVLDVFTRDEVRTAVRAVWLNVVPELNDGPRPLIIPTTDADLLVPDDAYNAGVPDWRHP